LDNHEFSPESKKSKTKDLYEEKLGAKIPGTSNASKTK
jgi:hypothetical protein